MHHLLGKQLLELGIRNLHAAILGPPLVRRRIADTVLAATLLRAEPCLMLLQYLNYLVFAETASLHRLSPFWRPG